jgi:hypothetical protein
MAVQVLGLLRRAPLIHSTGSALVQVAPAVQQKLGLQEPVQVTEPVLLVGFCLDGYLPRGKVGSC